MKYFNIKRNKFSTIFKNINFRRYNFSKIFKFVDLKRLNFNKAYKHFDIRRLDFYKKSKKIILLNYKYLSIYFVAFVIFIGLVYLIIPTFYSYDKSKIEKAICKLFSALVINFLDFHLFRFTSIFIFLVS